MTATKTQGLGPLPYIGGKSRLAPEIISRFPEHRTYVEAFAGGAQVFFRKPPSKVEVLNDLDGEIVNFYRICQRHHSAFLSQLEWLIAARKLFDRMLKADPETLTDLERAARFWFLQQMAWGGHRRGRHYAYGVTKRRFDPARIPDTIDRIRRRLAGVQIECLPYQEILRRYDREATLFYLDPPYWKRPYYRFNFEERDFEELAERLASIRGKFVLSLNDVPEVRRIFARFDIGTVETAYSSSGRVGKRFTELLIRNR